MLYFFFFSLVVTYYLRWHTLKNSAGLEKLDQLIPLKTQNILGKIFLLLQLVAIQWFFFCEARSDNTI